VEAREAEKRMNELLHSGRLAKQERDVHVKHVCELENKMAEALSACAQAHVAAEGHRRAKEELDGKVCHHSRLRCFDNI